MKRIITSIIITAALTGCVTLPTDNIGNGKLDLPGGTSIDMMTLAGTAAKYYGVDIGTLGLPGIVAPGTEQTVIESLEVRDADGKPVKLPLTEVVTRTTVTTRTVPVSDVASPMTNAPAVTTPPPTGPDAPTVPLGSAYPWTGKAVRIDGEGGISAAIQDWPEVCTAAITFDGVAIRGPDHYDAWPVRNLNGNDYICEYAVMCRYGDAWVLQWGDRQPAGRGGVRLWAESGKWSTPRGRTDQDEMWICATTASRNAGDVIGKRSNWSQVK